MDEGMLNRARDSCHRLTDYDLAFQYANGAGGMVPEAWHAVLEEIDLRGPAMRRRALQASANRRGMALCLSCAEEVSIDAIKCKHCGTRMKAEDAAVSDLEEEASTHDHLATVGWVLLPLGLLALVWSLQLDASVASNLGGRVNNIGLLNDKQNYVIASGVVSVVGAILVALRTRS